MVQVDVFWGYGFGASLAVASGVQLSENKESLYSKYFVLTVLFLALFWAPTGMLLLLRHPSWETMQAADTLRSIPPWLVITFGITNITQGILGFCVGQKLMAKGHYYWANLNWLLGYFGMFFILLYGWDGLGYDRFLYDRDMHPGSPAWFPGASGAQLDFLGAFYRHLHSSVAITLYEDGLYLLPPYFYLMYKWYKEACVKLAIPAVSAGRLIFSLLGLIFYGVLFNAFITAFVVNGIGGWMGVGNHVARALGQIPAVTSMHVLSYLIGIPLVLLIRWWVGLRKGTPFYWLLKPLMFGRDK